MQAPFTSMEDCHVLRDAVILLLGVVFGGGGLGLVQRAVSSRRSREGRHGDDDE